MTFVNYQCSINKKRKGFVFILFSLLFIVGGNAQNRKQFTPKTIIEKTSADWSFVTQMGDTKYIDFATAPFEIKEVQIFSINKELLVRDRVNDLPKSTLYEIKLSEKPAGFYVLHIKGKNQMMSKLFYLK